MLVSKFRVFEQPLACKIKTCESVIKAACVLHNFIRMREGIFSTPSHPQSIDSMGVQNNQELPLIQVARPTRDAENNRELLCNYFISNEGQVPWQENFS